MAAKKGDAIQNKAIKRTPLYFSNFPSSSYCPTQWMTSDPLAQRANPAMAPTTDCVVDTGNSNLVATANQMAADSKEQNIPSIKMSSSPTNKSQSTMPLRTVSVTVPPKPTAPTNS